MVATIVKYSTLYTLYTRLPHLSLMGLQLVTCSGLWLRILQRRHLN